MSDNQAFIVFNQNPSGRNDLVHLTEQITKMKSDIVAANE
jgi:hypothetical protein